MAANRCPSCGAPASGQFCSECGTALRARVCRQCGGEVQPGAKFCTACGTPAGAPGAPARGRAGGAARSGLPVVPLAVAGVAVVALALVFVARSPSARPPASSSAAAGVAAAGALPDLSQMTPREAFGRLYDRVMTAAEQGDTATVSRFMPMTLQAYGNLPATDADARFDVALLRLHTGDLAGAQALADSIRAEQPDHLFGFILVAAIGKFEGKRAQLQATYARFLAVRDAELKAGRPEYDEHRTMLDNFTKEAREGARER